MKRTPTMTDVARRAGVSVATVSRVLNGGRASDAAVQAVRGAAAALGYRPNRLARGLVTGRSGVIGVVVPDLLGPLYAAMAHGIEDVLVPHGLHAVLATDDRDPAKERASIDLLMTRRVDGLVLVGSSLADEALRDVAAEVPLVLLQRESHGSAFEELAIDNHHGVEQAIAHLWEAGHRRIAYIGGVRRDGRERADALRGALTRRGAAPVLELDADFSEEGGVAAGARLLDAGTATAVLCANDRTAVGVYHAAATRALRIPDDLSVIGFDDLPWGRYLDPPLTTVRQPARAMGSMAAQRLLERSHEGVDAGVPWPAEGRVRPDLVSRGSVGAPAGHGRGAAIRRAAVGR